MRILYLIRGISGVGKSTLAKQLSPDYCIFEADNYFYDENGNFNFDTTKLGFAHNQCIVSVEDGMKINKWGYEGDYNKIVVSNTSTTEKELKPYLTLAEKYDYQVVCMVLEKRHNGINQHGVPQEKLEQMAEKLKNNIKLI